MTIFYRAITIAMKQQSKSWGSRRRLGASLGSMLAGTLALLTTGQAHAVASYSVPRSASNTWTMGNSTFSAVASLVGQTSVDGYNSEGRAAYETSADEYVMVIGEVFGKRGIVLDAQIGADVSSRSAKYVEIAGRLKVMGSTVWSTTGSDNSACPSSSEALVGCARYDKDWSKTFFSVSMDFPISIFVVNVKASVKGGIRGHLGTHAVVMQGAPTNKKHHLGIINNDAGAGAYATAYLTAAVGVGSADVLGVGVDGSFGLVDVSATAKAGVVHRNDDVSRTSSTTWNLGVDLGTMDGSVDVWAQATPWFRASERLISWSGFHKYIPIAEKTLNATLAPIDI